MLLPAADFPAAVRKAQPMSQRLTLDYEFSDALAEQVATLQIAPELPSPPHAKLLPALLAIPLMLVLASEWDFKWELLVPAVLVAVAVGIPYSIWGFIAGMRLLAFRRVRRLLLTPFRDLPHRNISWRFSEERFTFCSALRTVNAEWRDVADLVYAQGFTSMKVRWGEIVMIPNPVLTQDIADLMTRKAKAYGARLLRIGKKRA
jgi:hypothetical protein